MKKIALKLFMLILTPLLLFCFEADAQLLPPGPTTITVDGEEAPAESGNSAITAIKKGLNKIQEWQTKLNEQIAALKEKLGLGERGNDVTNKDAGDSTVPSSRKIVRYELFEAEGDSDDEKTQKEEKFVQQFEEMFLRYPVELLDSDKYKENQPAVKKAYVNKGIEFANDSLLEMYISVHNLDTIMTQFKEDFDKLSDCYVKGESSDSEICAAATSTDRDPGIWNNFYRVMLAYDTMLRFTEEITAIQANYVAAQAIISGLKPFDKAEQAYIDGEDERTSSNQQQSSADDIWQMTREIPMASAQVMTSDELNSSSETSTSETSSDGTSTFSLLSKDLKTRNSRLSVLNPIQVYTPVTGAENNFKAMAQLANSWAQIQLAFTAHNLKRQLPEYRKTFLSVDQMRQLHEKSMEKLRESEICVTKYLSQYYASPDNIWLGAGCTYQGKTIFCRTGKKVTEDTLRSVSEGDILCPDDATQLCKTLELNNYDQRSGIAGWLVAAYREAKAAKTMEIGEDDLMPSQRSADEGTDLQDFRNNVSNADESASVDALFADAEKNEQFEQNQRDLELLTWQIGAEAAKQIGSDMTSNDTMWGASIYNYPVWNDERIFYDMYLSKKYTNMKQYLSNMDLRRVIAKTALEISDLLNSTGADEKYGTLADFQAYNESVLNQVISLIEQDQATTQEKLSEIEQLKQTYDQKYEALQSSYKQKMETLNEQKQAVVKQISETNAELKPYLDEYNKLLSELQTVDSESEAVDEFSDELHQRAEDTDGNYVTTGFDERNAAEKTVLSTSKSQKQARLAEVTPIVEGLQEKLDDLLTDLDGVREAITQARSDGAETFSKFEKEKAQAIKRAVASYTNNNKNSTLSGSSLLSRAMSSLSANAFQKAVLRSAVTLAEAYVQAALTKEEAVVDAAYERLMAMGEKLYDMRYYAQIESIHDSLLDNMQYVTLESIQTTLDVPGVSASLGSVIGTQFYKEVCSDIKCSNADTEYFVGLPPKARDFMTPKGIVDDAYTAPLREIVHLDMIDYDNIGKTPADKTSRMSFLDYGQDIPNIWKRMLEPNGFVDQDVDLDEFFELSEGEDDHLMRGGIYPCNFGSRDIDIKNDGFYIYPASGATVECQDINSVSGSSILFKNGETWSASVGKEKDTRRSSELAYVLKYSSSLGFNNKLKSLVAYFENQEKSASSSSVQEDDMQTQMYSNAFLKRNQFGDYLDQVEQESTYQTAVENLEETLEDSRDKIRTAVATLGSEEMDKMLEGKFDLADDEFFEKFLDLADKYKDHVMEYANELLGGVSAKDNAVVKEEYDRQANAMKLLSLDGDEILSLAAGTPADDAFIAKLKEERANRAVIDRYREEADEAFEKRLNGFKDPYCAAY